MASVAAPLLRNVENVCGWLWQLSESALAWRCRRRRHIDFSAEANSTTASLGQSCPCLPRAAPTKAWRRLPQSICWPSSMAPGLRYACSSPSSMLSQVASSRQTSGNNAKPLAASGSWLPPFPSLCAQPAALSGKPRAGPCKSRALAGKIGQQKCAA